MGCATTNAAPHAIYPKALFQCLDAPKTSEIVNDNTLAVFVARLSAAHTDCKSRLTNMEPLLNGEEQ